MRKLTAKRKTVSDVCSANAEPAEMPRTEVGEWLEAPVVVAMTAAAGATATSALSSARAAATVTVAVYTSSGPGRRKRPFVYPVEKYQGLHIM